jgi:SRSO17 transposase
MTGRPNTHCDTIAHAMPGTSEPRSQEFLANMLWDADDLHRQRVQKRSAEATLGDGVLVLDDPGFPKPGNASVGVSRQYPGTLGKVGHGHLAVTGCDSDPQASWPVAVRRYLPKAWAVAPHRRANALGPVAMTLQTKPAIALLQVEELAGYVHRRDAVEQCHEEAKGELGWAQSQGRLWSGFTGMRPRSWWPEEDLWCEA